jgi:hypothetical protein
MNQIQNVNEFLAITLAFERFRVAHALDDYYNTLATSGVDAQGYNIAYNNALNAIRQTGT